MDSSQPLTPARLEAVGHRGLLSGRATWSLSGSRSRSSSALLRTVASRRSDAAFTGWPRPSQANSRRFAMVASAIPGGIVCLLSALPFTRSAPKSPHEVWLALDRKARKPSRSPARVRIVRFSGPCSPTASTRRSFLASLYASLRPPAPSWTAFATGTKSVSTSPLKRFATPSASRNVTLDEIVRAAEVCRARTVIRTYLEALAHDRRARKTCAASVRDRLLNRSRETGEDFQFLLQRYASERFLYRLGELPPPRALRPQRRHAVRPLGRVALPADSRLDFTGYGRSETDACDRAVRRSLHGARAGRRACLRRLRRSRPSLFARRRVRRAARPA